MISFFLLFALGASAAPAWHTTLSSALEEAKSSGKPVLMDFQAPWCYSCYYMEKHVLEGAAFSKNAERVVLLKLDVDTQEGRLLREKFKIPGLPGYLVVSAKQEALGRIVGEQTEDDFVKQLDAILGGSSTDPAERAVVSLQKRLNDGELDKAAADIRGLKAAERKALESRADWRVLSARLELYRAVARDSAGAVEPLKTSLALDDSCAAAEDVKTAADIVDKQKPAARKDLLELERTSLEKLAAARLFVPADKRCADFRSGVEILADVYEKLGLKDQRADLFKKTLAFLDQQGLKPGEDRNFDDNKREFLDLAGDEQGLREFYPALIAAYPADYVYAARWARWLQEHGKSREALAFSDAADKLAYGANRLAVTRVRALILADLGRKPEALALLARDSKAGRKAFSKEAAALDALAGQLSKR
jgi:thiol-disulfide isomerase/thioredoxin